jgi:hypothetical protein
VRYIKRPPASPPPEVSGMARTKHLSRAPQSQRPSRAVFGEGLEHYYTKKGKKREGICPICQKSVLLHNLGRHIRDVHDKYRHFSCSFCYYSTNSKTDLKRHKKRMH